MFLWFLALSLLVFLRPPTTNFIYDEQEALLGNPYLAAPSDYLDAFRVDFWGRAPERTIGSYRPIPNLLWWPLKLSLGANTPFFFCLLNLLGHALCATLVALCVARLVRGKGLTEETERWAIGGAGGFFLVSGTSTEAVCSAVGLADILVGVVSAVQLLAVIHFSKAPGLRRGFFAGGVCFLCGLVGLLSKESMIGSLLWLPLLPLFCAASLSSRRQAVGAGVGLSVVAVLSLFSFVRVRASLFPARRASVPTFVREGSLADLSRPFFEWFGQPKMPVDSLNNPLIDASVGDRWATVFEIFFEQVVQLLLPWSLNADYSYPRQLVSSGGVLSTLGALVVAIFLWVILDALRLRARGTDLGIARQLSACGVLIFFLSYLPVSNAFALLPTIRGDRLLYTPTLGGALLVAAAVVALGRSKRSFIFGSLGALLALHAIFARLHALDYRNDVAFWRATSRGERPSAKSLLNWGVMLGARGDEQARLHLTRRALELAPGWPMGQVYLGDVLCRLDRASEAFPYYLSGFSSEPNSKALTALGLQCLWDRGEFEKRRVALLDLAAKHPDTWLDYFVTEVSLRGAQHGGIPPKYRPRKYNARASITSSPEPATSPTGNQR